MEKGESIPEEKETIEKNISSLYKECENFISSDECTQNLRNELEKSIPDCLTVLRKWKNDLENSDHGIVIAGETSAGKSTLINKLFGKQLFRGRNNESTSTICKLRNSERIRVITTDMRGQREETDFTDKCNLETKEGVKMLRNFLKDLTDLTSSEKSATFNSVEVEFPIPFLRGNMILVDTPGIGGSGNVTDKLIEYLPNALLFIFVINAGSAGGMQNDRIAD
nr:transmembrane GTPase Marf-like [Crassostrea gigas]